MNVDEGRRITTGGRCKNKKKSDLIPTPLALHCLAALAALDSGPAAVNQILTDGRARTAIKIAGAAGIGTKTVRGCNASNAFRHSRRLEGSTVNLYLPEDTQHLINRVHPRGAVVDGMLDGRIGGHVVFVDPHEWYWAPAA